MSIHSVDDYVNLLKPENLLRTYSSHPNGQPVFFVGKIKGIQYLVTTKGDEINTEYQDWDINQLSLNPDDPGNTFAEHLVLRVPYNGQAVIL